MIICEIWSLHYVNQVSGMVIKPSPQPNNLLPLDAPTHLTPTSTVVLTSVIKLLHCSVFWKSSSQNTTFEAWDDLIQSHSCHFPTMLLLTLPFDEWLHQYLMHMLACSHIMSLCDRWWIDWDKPRYKFIGVIRICCKHHTSSYNQLSW